MGSLILISDSQSERPSAGKVPIGGIMVFRFKRLVKRRVGYIRGNIRKLPTE